MFKKRQQEWKQDDEHRSNAAPFSLSYVALNYDLCGRSLDIGFAYGGDGGNRCKDEKIVSRKDRQRKILKIKA